MSSGLTPAFANLLLASVPFLLFAVLLLRRGLRPKRVGTTPHCAKCNYNLTGLSSERCPECGETLSSGHVVYGEPRQSLSRVVLGAICAAIGLFCLIGAILSVDWNRYRPTGWLISDLASASPASDMQAWLELSARDAAGELSASQRSRLIDVCLKEQASTGSGPLTSNMMDYLGQSLLAGRMTKAQEETFYSQMFTVELTARPTVILGEPAAYRLSYRGRGPSTNIWSRHSDGNLAVDGKIIRKGESGSGSFSGTGAGGSTGSSVLIDSPGRHTLGLESHFKVYTGPMNQESQSRLLREFVFPLKADFEVLTTAPADYVRRVSQPDSAAIHACIKPAHFRFESEQKPRLHGTLEIDKPPANLAFKVILRIHGQEHEAGSINLRRGQSTHYGIGKYWYEPGKAPPPFTSCDVILRGSEDVARRTVDLFEFWDGELVYKDVPVTVESPASQESQPAEP